MCLNYARWVLERGPLYCGYCLGEYYTSIMFRVGLIFAEFATSLKSPNIYKAKNKPYLASSLRVLELEKIGLSENSTHLPSDIFATISLREKIPDMRYKLPILFKTGRLWYWGFGFNTKWGEYLVRRRLTRNLTQIQYGRTTPYRVSERIGNEYTSSMTYIIIPV